MAMNLKIEKCRMKNNSILKRYMILDGILVAIKIVFTRRKKLNFVVSAKTSPKS